MILTARAYTFIDAAAMSKKFSSGGVNFAPALGVQRNSQMVKRLEMYLENRLI